MKNLINVFNIDGKNNHNALNDSEILYKLYKKIYLEEIETDRIKNKLAIEFLRPRRENNLKTPFIKWKVEEQKISSNYKVIFNNCSIKCKDINDKSLFISEFNIKIYNNKSNLILNIRESKQFENKKDANDFIFSKYDELFKKTDLNFVMINNNKDTKFFDFYKKKTKNIN